jgi:uroporphyrinogen decarboxylase
VGLCAAAFGTRRAQRKLRSSKAAVVTCVSAIKTAKDAGVTTEHAPHLKEAPDNLPELRAQAWEEVLAAGGPWPAPKNDRLLRAARGETNDRAPKWMMRQAGRYLPEYQAVLKASDFFTVCQTPALACEVTLQPIRRYKTLDSMIIFCDILVIPVAMGMPCGMVEGVGPTFDFAIETPEDMKKLNLTPNVQDSLSYVFDAVFWTRQQSNNEIPVIGFAGAPWTLMGYMVEGGAVRSFDRAKKWLYLYPEASRQLLTALRDIVVEYLVGQYDSGAPLLQVFDTNCGEVPPGVYEEFMVDDLKHIATEVKKRRPHALMSLFPKDGELAAFNDSDYDVIGVSWTTSPSEARRMCPDKTLQGNFDPYCLYADPAHVKTTAQKMVREFGVDRYIANLGHGMMPTHPVEGPQAFTEGVDSVSRD